MFLILSILLHVIWQSDAVCGRLVMEKTHLIYNNLGDKSGQGHGNLNNFESERHKTHACTCAHTHTYAHTSL